MERCPACNSAATIELLHQRAMTRATEHVIFYTAYTQCLKCGREFVTNDQAIRNHLVQLDADRIS